MNILWKRIECCNYKSITVFAEVDKGQTFVTGLFL